MSQIYRKFTITRVPFRQISSSLVWCLVWFKLRNCVNIKKFVLTSFVKSTIKKTEMATGLHSIHLMVVYCLCLNVFDYFTEQNLRQPLAELDVSVNKLDLFGKIHVTSCDQII